MADIERAGRSRGERFSEVFEAAYAPLVAYARRRVPAAEVDDVVAETLLVAWRRLDDVPAAAPLPWLYGVARRLIANRARGDARRTRLLGRLRSEPVAPVGADDGDRTGVLGALAALGEADREVLRLAAWEQLRPAEIALVLGCSANAAALRLSRARRKLRIAMTDPAASRTQVRWRSADG